MPVLHPLENDYEQAEVQAASQEQMPIQPHITEISSPNINRTTHDAAENIINDIPEPEELEVTRPFIEEILLEVVLKVFSISDINESATVLFLENIQTILSNTSQTTSTTSVSRFTRIPEFRNFSMEVQTHTLEMIESAHTEVLKPILGDRNNALITEPNEQATTKLNRNEKRRLRGQNRAEIKRQRKASTATELNYETQAISLRKAWK